MPRLLPLLLILLFAPNALAFDQQALMRVFFSVVLVRGYDTSGNLAYGTGVVVAQNKVITNCHVLRSTPRAWISQGEEVYNFKSVRADTRHDLCLLEFESLPLKPVPVGNTVDLHNGDEVFAMGHSNGVLAPQSSGGQVASIYPYEDGNVVRSSARFSLGASGSPLFDSQGRLIGINTFKTPGRVAYFYAVPVEWLREVEKLPAQTALPVAGQAFWELPDDEKPYFMQAALPHLQEDWPRLAAVSQRWIVAEPENSEAWFELGTAQEGMRQTEEAQISYRKAIALNPQHGAALFRLGVFASQRGDREELHNISLTLVSIDQTLAEDLRKAAGCSAEC
jgi:hypothetical protein